MNKRNKTLMISGLIWAALALIITLVGLMVSGFNLIAWFSSKYAMFFYVFLGIYLIGILLLFVIPYIKSRL